MAIRSQSDLCGGGGHDRSKTYMNRTVSSSLSSSTGRIQMNSSPSIVYTTMTEYQARRQRHHDKHQQHDHEWHNLKFSCVYLLFSLPLFSLNFYSQPIYRGPWNSSLMNSTEIENLWYTPATHWITTTILISCFYTIYHFIDDWILKRNQTKLLQKMSSLSFIIFYVFIGMCLQQCQTVLLLYIGLEYGNLFFNLVQLFEHLKRYICLHYSTRISHTTWLHLQPLSSTQLLNTEIVSYAYMIIYQFFISERYILPFLYANWLYSVPSSWILWIIFCLNHGLLFVITLWRFHTSFQLKMINSH
jgi:hypothetical protein